MSTITPTTRELPAGVCKSCPPAPIVLDTSELPASAQFVTSQQMAEMLQVSVRTIFRAVADGSLPQPVRLTRKFVRWRLVDVQTWIERNGAVGERDPEAPVQAVAEPPADLVSVWAAAKLLNVHLTTMRRYVAESRLQSYSVGRRIAVSKGDVLALLVEFEPNPECNGSGRAEA